MDRRRPEGLPPPVKSSIARALSRWRRAFQARSVAIWPRTSLATGSSAGRSCACRARCASCRKGSMASNWWVKFDVQAWYTHK